MGKEIYIERIISSLQSSIAGLSADMAQMSNDMKESVNVLNQIMAVTGSTVSNFNVTGSTFANKINAYKSKYSNDFNISNGTVSFTDESTFSVMSGSGNPSEVLLDVLFYAPEDTTLTGKFNINNANYQAYVSVYTGGSSNYKSTTSATPEDIVPIPVSAGWHRLRFGIIGSSIGSGWAAGFSGINVGGVPVFSAMDQYTVTGNNTVIRSGTAVGKTNIYVTYVTSLGVSPAEWLLALLRVAASDNVNYEFSLHKYGSGELILSSANETQFDISDLLTASQLVFKLSVTYDPSDPGTFEYGGFVFRYL